jgi:2-succinyl-5-enolpyruvyl-6-hydroxy-3-cyclohexene-1-carboxylate synthase
MIHPLQHIADLSEICFNHGVSFVVISPGSRNAPLIDAFSARFGEKCYSIVDERSAGYFALGLARNSKKPVVLVCTSGTAALNYGPALAEAYYQRIPLVAVTADRPARWIDQQDNQTIRQNGIYKQFIKQDFTLPEVIRDEKSLKELHALIGLALSVAVSGSWGPVHINVPLGEPLYGELPEASQKINLKRSQTGGQTTGIPDDFFSQFNLAKGICIIHGQDLPDRQQMMDIHALAEDHRVVFIAEDISNICSRSFIRNPELMLAHARKRNLVPPDLLIYSGGQLVSKKMKEFLRSYRIANTWRIGEDDYDIDTFSQQNKILRLPVCQVYRELTAHVRLSRESLFKSSWQEADHHARKFFNDSVDHLPFSDLSVVYRLLNSMPQTAILELGNSSPVRYSQLVPSTDCRKVYSNRGVSGIDGCLSAAVGTSLSSGELTIAVLGDLSFVYDSNALWNKKLPDNLRIVVLNNRGGGIFSLIDGPSGKPSFEDYFLAHHPVNLQKLAEAFNLNYFCVKNNRKLTDLLPDFFGKMGRAAVLEVFTERTNNLEAFNRIMGREVNLQAE